MNIPDWRKLWDCTLENRVIDLLHPNLVTKKITVEPLEIENTRLDNENEEHDLEIVGEDLVGDYYNPTLHFGRECEWGGGVGYHMKRMEPGHVEPWTVGGEPWRLRRHWTKMAAQAPDGEHIMMKDRDLMSMAYKRMEDAADAEEPVLGERKEPQGER
jgi:hypothetical protein